jgi:UDP-N-acetylglucosamine 2-epimerase (non-hydrolysing)/UDP-GlcNAc3NAcA epimerase
MRIATIVGNRPQFVKAAAVSHLLRAEHDEVLVHTGQHHDDELSAIFFEELGIPRPQIQLAALTGTNTAQTARMLAALEGVLSDVDPDLVLVYGDTNSTLAGGLAAAQMRIPLAHVEAGMRSFDRAMPEELARVLTDHASDILLVPTPHAVENLRREGIEAGVHLVGDVMADVSLTFAPIAEQRSTLLGELGLEPESFVLATAHRAGNVDDPANLERLVAIFERVGEPLVLPLHPRTRARLEATGKLERLREADHVILTPPLGYLDFLALTRAARRILTDSGGVQKEAYILATPCVTLRDTTEWVETVDAGWNALVGLDADAAIAALAAPAPPGPRPDLYGGGHAGERIVGVLSAAAGKVARRRRGRAAPPDAAAVEQVEL